MHVMSRQWAGPAAGQSMQTADVLISHAHLHLVVLLAAGTWRRLPKFCTAWILNITH